MGHIFFCGDVHGNFEHIIEAVREHRPAAIVFLGDLQPQRPLEQELRPILGLTETMQSDLNDLLRMFHLRR